MFSSIANQDVMKTDILLYRQQCLFSHGGNERNLDQFGNKNFHLCLQNRSEYDTVKYKWVAHITECCWR